MALGRLLQRDYVAKQGFQVIDGEQNFVQVPPFGGRPNLSGILEPDGSFATFVANGYRRNELVYACIALRAESLPQAVLRVYPRGPSNEPLDDHRLRKLVETPNPVTTEFEQVELLSTYKDLAGINYQLIQRGRDGFPSALWPLRPDLVGVLPSARDPAVFAWVYRPNPDRPDIQVVIPSSDMVVVRNPNPNPLNPADRYFGHAPLRPAARAVSLDNAATDFVDRLLRNDATPTAVVTTSEAITAEVADRLKTRWMNRFSGVNRGGPVFLQKGMDVKPLGLNLRDLEFPDLRTISESRICMAIGRTPPILVGAKVGLDRSTFANYHEAVLSWWQGPLRSEQRRYADAMNARLVSDFTGVGRRPVLFGWDNSDVPALKEAESAKWERATNALARGGITQNDFRRTVGLPPVPGGDQFLIPAGVVPTPAGQPGEDAVSASLDLTAAEYGIELTTEERLALTAGSEE